MIGLSRSTYYYKPLGESQENLAIMLELDKQYTKTPFFGVPKMWAHLRSLKMEVNIKRVRRLMRLMGLETIYSKPRLSIPDKEHIKYPYLLRNLLIDSIDQVWSMDITYIPMKQGFMYLTAVIDWHSRFVLAWKLSNTLEDSFCIEALEESFQYGKPEIFNTDQGSQFTGERFTGVLKSKEIRISMDGRGRALDNVFIERLWRTVKYEYIYLHAQETVMELYEGLKAYFDFYNYERQHQSLDYKTPAEIYFSKKKLTASA